MPPHATQGPLALLLSPTEEQQCGTSTDEHESDASSGEDPAGAGLSELLERGDCLGRGLSDRVVHQSCRSDLVLQSAGAVIGKGGIASWLGVSSDGVSVGISG